MMRGILRRRERQVRNQRARSAAMGRNHGIPVQRCVTLAYPGSDLLIAFTPWRPEAPRFRFAVGDVVLVSRQSVSIDQTFPVAERNLGKPRSDGMPGALQ